MELRERLARGFFTAWRKQMPGTLTFETFGDAHLERFYEQADIAIEVLGLDPTEQVAAPVHDVTFEGTLKVQGKTIRCGDHRIVQHRDGKVPWCNTCGKTSNGIHHDDLKPFWEEEK